MAESTAISIKKFDGTDYKSWSLEVEILLEQKQVLGIVDGTEEAPEDATELKSWKKQHGIARSTILLTMERSLQQQYGVQKDAKALWDQLKEDYKSKVKLNVWALRDEISAVKLRDCENVQEYASKILGHVNDFNLCADSSTGSGTMPKSEHSYYLMQGIPKDDDWRFFTQLMYNKIDTLADKPEEIVTKMKAHEVRLQKDDDSEVAAMFSKLQTKSEKRNSKHSRKSQRSRGSGSESDGSSSESEKHRCRHTQECYSCHKVGHIAWYCPSTAPVESGAQTETAAAAVTTTTSIENYWMTVTTRESPSKESWYVDCATTSHICGDRQEFVRYTQYAKRDEQEIHDFAGRVAGKAIGYGDVQLRLRLPGYRRNHEVVVRNVLHIEGAHNSLSQSRLMDRGLQIVPVNGYGIKIYDKLPAEESAGGQGRGRGWGNLLGLARQIWGLFRLDVKDAGKRNRARG